MGERRDRLAGRLMAMPPMSPLDRVCRGGVEIVGARTCAVVLMSGDDAGSLAASFGPAAEVAADLQFSLGEGPCRTAFHDGEAVTAPDLAVAPGRWPLFAPAALAAGVAAVTALPLRVGAIRVGVLYLAHDTAGPMAHDAMADAFELAGLATLVVLDHQHHGRDVLGGAAAKDGWAHRAVVHQATGMVSAQLDIPLDDALARLRAAAFAQERPIYDMAVDIVDRRVRLSHDDGNAGTRHEP